MCEHTVVIRLVNSSESNIQDFIRIVGQGRRATRVDDCTAEVELPGIASDAVPDLLVLLGSQTQRHNEVG